LQAQITPYTNNTPQLSNIIANAVVRATTKEDANDDLFNNAYSYTRSRTWVYRDGSGNLKSFEKKDTYENRQLRAAQAALHPKPASPAPKPILTPRETESTNSPIKGKALKVKNFSITNIVARFQYTLIGQETINGRPAYVIDFVPKKHLEVHQLADHLINLGAGRVWIDEQEFAVVKAQVHIVSPISIAWGTVGELKTFTYNFTRIRTPEGFWYCDLAEWHLKAREVILDRIVDYKERRSNVSKITPESLQLDLQKPPHS
jgi:hypothetical protein